MYFVLFCKRQLFIFSIFTRFIPLKAILYVNSNIFCSLGADIMQLERNAQSCFCKQLEMLYAFLFPSSTYTHLLHCMQCHNTSEYKMMIKELFLPFQAKYCFITIVVFAGMCLFCFKICLEIKVESQIQSLELFWTYSWIFIALHLSSHLTP